MHHQFNVFFANDFVLLDRLKASPIAQKIANERNIDLSQVKGSGPGGRIVKEDVENYKPGKYIIQDWCVLRTQRDSC